MRSANTLRKLSFARRSFATKYYTKSHEWISEVEPETYRIGISNFAAEQLGDIVHIELPEVEDSFEKEADFGAVESVKMSSNVYMPTEGDIVSINEVLLDQPENLNEDPEGEGWMITVKSASFDKTGLLEQADYEAFIRDE